MKKILALVLIVALLVVPFAACTPNTDAPAADNKADEPAKAEEPAKADEPAKAEEPAKADEPAKEDEPAEFDGEFKIGMYYSLNDLDGKVISDAITLYADRTNAEGGLFGKKVVPVFYDNPDGSTENAVKIAKQMIEIDKIDVHIAGLSGNTLATGEMFEKAEIPVYGLGLSPTWMNQGWKYFFRPTLNTDFAAPQLAKLVKKMGYNSVGVFEGQDDYGKSAGATFRDCAAAEGIAITTTENYQSGVDVDFSGQVSKIMNSGAEGVYLACLGGDIGNVMKQFRSFGYKGVFFYSESLRSDMVEVAEGGSDHTVICFPYVVYNSVEEGNTEHTREFLQMWQDAFGEVPQTTMAYKVWDALTTIDLAVKAAGSTDGPAIQAATKTLKFEGIGGNFDFTTESNEGLFDFYGFIYIDGMRAIFVDDWMASDDYKEFMAASKG